MTNMSYEETVKEIENTFGIFPEFMKNTPEDILPQMWPLFKKYQIGKSVIPEKYRDDDVSGSSSYQMSILSNLSQGSF